MTQQEIQTILTAQRDFFRSGQTLPVEFRLKALRRLGEVIRRREGDILTALERDLGKSGFEGYLCEVGMTLSEITYMGKHLRRFAAEKRVATPLSQFPARSYTKPGPHGVTLIMSPWNYPFLLTMEPLTDALAAGNTVVLKPSAYSPHTGEVIQSIISECFDPAYVAVVTGGREENAHLLREEFDHIFFTGSQPVGREVMAQAARHLTPVTLELGGKSPCIVDASANIPLAARRIVFGKFLNCGQTCVAPDYIFCHASVHDTLIRELTAQIRSQFGEHPLENGDYGKLVNQKHFDRVAGLIDPAKVVFGGTLQPEALRIEPTLLDNVTWADPVMEEEIFGPVLPILTYTDLSQVVEEIDARPHPLALYLFTGSRATVRQVTSRCRYGGGCVNDTIIHLATSRMGFGGVGASGMGSYHGRAGFETFSHRKSMVDKRTWLDLPMRYQPYRPIYDRVIRWFLR